MGRYTLLTFPRTQVSWIPYLDVAPLRLVGETDPYRKLTQYLVFKILTPTIRVEEKNRRDRSHYEFPEYYEGHLIPYSSKGRSFEFYHHVVAELHRQVELCKTGKIFNTQPAFKRTTNHEPSYPPPCSVYTSNVRKWQMDLKRVKRHRDPSQSRSINLTDYNDHY